MGNIINYFEDDTRLEGVFFPLEETEIEITTRAY